MVSFIDSPEEKRRLENLPYSLNHNIKELLDGFKWAVHEKNTSAVSLFDGRSGMGKSTLAIMQAKYCDPDFDLHKIHFTPETFVNGEFNSEGKLIRVGLAQAKKGDYILYDEALPLSNRSTMSLVNRMIILSMSMIRSKRIFVGFCANSIFDLDRNLVLSRADVLFHIYGDNLVDRGKVMAFFKGGDSRDRLKELYLRGKKYYDYGQPKSNFNCVFPARFMVDEIQYEKEKQEGINKFMAGKPETGGVKYKTIKSRDLLVMHLRSLGYLIKEIADIAEISTREIDNIIAKNRKEADK